MFSYVQFFYAMLCIKQDLWIRSSTVNWPQNLAYMRSWQEWSWEVEFHWDSSNLALFTALPSHDLWFFSIRSCMGRSLNVEYPPALHHAVKLDTELDWDLQSDTCSLLCNSSMPCYANKICESGVPLWIGYRTLRMRSWQEWSWESEFHWDSSKLLLFHSSP